MCVGFAAGFPVVSPSYRGNYDYLRFIALYRGICKGMRSRVACFAGVL